MDKTTECSSREPKFDSQNPHGGLHVFIRPVLGNSTPLASLYRHSSHPSIQAKYLYI